MVASTARVGIVIRTRNRPYFLARALSDVMAQSRSDWQVVIANDGGDRAEVEAVIRNRLKEADGRITLIDIARPGGRCVAANQALRQIDAPFVVLHDDDDTWHRDFLTTAVDWLERNPADSGVMVPTEIVYEREDAGLYVETGRAPFWGQMTQVTFSDMLTVNRAVPISFLYRRELHDEVGYYDESLETVEDWEFYLRVTARRHIGFVAGRPLAYWHQRPAAADDSANSMFFLADAHSRDDAFVRDRALREYVMQYGAGLPLFLAGEINAAELRAEQIARQLVEDATRWSLAGLARRVRKRFLRHGRREARNSRLR